MKQIDDPQLAFYLRHQSQIDEWSALASRVPEAADAFLSSLSADLDALAEELDPRATPFRSLSDDTSYPKLFLIDPAWSEGGAKEQDEDDPLLGIGLEWHRGKAGFTTPPHCAYIGAWYNKATIDEARLSRLKKAVSEARARTGQKLPATWWWLACRYEPASGEYWSDLSLYRGQLLDSIRFMWRTFAPVIRAALV